MQLERWKETREFVKLDSLAIGPCVKREIVFLADRLLFDYSVQFVNYYFPNVEEDEFFYVAFVTAIISATVVLSSTAEDDKFVLLFPVFTILFGLGIANVIPIQFKREMVGNYLIVMILVGLLVFLLKWIEISIDPQVNKKIAFGSGALFYSVSILSNSQADIFTCLGILIMAVALCLNIPPLVCLPFVIDQLPTLRNSFAIYFVIRALGLLFLRTNDTNHFHYARSVGLMSLTAVDVYFYSCWKHQTALSIAFAWDAAALALGLHVIEKTYGKMISPSYSTPILKNSAFFEKIATMANPRERFYSVLQCPNCIYRVKNDTYVHPIVDRMPNSSCDQVISCDCSVAREKKHFCNFCVRECKICGGGQITQLKSRMYHIYLTNCKKEKKLFDTAFENFNLYRAIVMVLVFLQGIPSSTPMMLIWLTLEQLHLSFPHNHSEMIQWMNSNSPGFEFRNKS